MAAPTPDTTPPTTSPPILVHTASPSPGPEAQLPQQQHYRSLGHRARASGGGGGVPTHAQLHLPESGLPPSQQQTPQPQPHSQQHHAHPPPQPQHAPQHHLGHRRGGQAKPLFDWISRKLGARRASDAEPRDAVPSSSGSGSGSASGYYWGSRPTPPAPAPERPPPASRAEARTARRELQRHQSPADMFRQSSYDSSAYRAESLSLHSYAVSERRREANNPYPSLPIPLVRRSYPASTIDDSGSMAPSASLLSRSRTPSIASLDGPRHRTSADGGASFSSSFRLAGRVADEDASVRPLPPSLATSPARSISILSRSGSVPLMRSDSAPQPLPPQPSELDRRNTFSSSVGPDAPSFVSSDVSGDILSRVSREDSLASTKPATTVISFESGNAPVAHIAVAPSPSSTSSPPVVRSASSPAGMSIAHSAGPTALPSPISPTFLPGSVVSEDVQHTVPRHTRYHPRNNPHPSAPPGPDASTLTLASSTFGFVSPQAIGARPGSLRLRDGASPSAYHAPVVSPSVAFADRPGSTHEGGRPLSNYDGLSSHAMSLSTRNRNYGRADDDASMRAIRRRGSWESGESRWSWRPGAETAASGVFGFGRRGTGELPDDDANRSSVYTHNSYRTPLPGIGGVEEGEGMTAITSESGLVSHRPVSVVV
ncbi:hypothetical protein Q8F55_009144 [Vanrija albida]|uniref:Proteophosphoglycan ppg4 n=1 Tax=Vanrija albida TaxID=181172 RepID=A0ABR3PST0_9TREE